MDNKSFWNERYHKLPVLGSGPGSRGAAALRKRKIFRNLAEHDSIQNIVDIGCGDVSWYEFGLLGDTGYTGIDISDVVVNNNSEKYPELSFVNYDLSEGVPTGIDADVYVCFDVLLHQCNEEKFTRMLENILFMVTNHALISYPSENERQNIAINIAQSDEEMRLDGEFVAILNQLDNDRPRGSVRIFSDFVGRIHELDSSILVRRVGQYRTHPLENNSHMIYELSRCGSWLNLDADIFKHTI